MSSEKRSISRQPFERLVPPLKIVWPGSSRTTMRRIDVTQ